MKQHVMIHRWITALICLAMLMTAACATATESAAPPESSSSSSKSTDSAATAPNDTESQAQSASSSSAASKSASSETSLVLEASESAAVQNLAQTSDAEEQAWLALGLEEAHSLNASARTYHPISETKDQIELCAALDALTVEKGASADKSKASIAGFLTIRNGLKASYMVTDTQIYSTSQDATTVYQSDMKLRTKLKELSDGYNRRYDAYPQWLSYMTVQRITKVEFSGKTQDESKDASFTTTDKNEMRRVAAALKRLGVKPVAVDRDTMLNPTTSGKGYSVKLTFDSGVEYLIYGASDSDQLAIKSSDISAGITYTLESVEQLIKLYEIAEQFSGCVSMNANPDTAKPVIYLYPERPTDVSVKLAFGGELTYTYPDYGSGWQVTAYPDGRLVNRADSTEHFYLFWEGNSGTEWSFDEGFCVAGSETEAFLREKLALMGLTPREYNDFLVYWVPEMKQNRYNLITFAAEQYEQLAPLTVSPAPDSVLRVHMVYKPVSAPVEIAPQTFRPFVRSGFTLVEWGGSRAEHTVAGKPNHS